uniref:NADH dehydrogenase subunit 6 n=1 Tax=Clavisyllis tenjini TaxID=3041283 RepID=UPI002551F87A|nr:NADH dehydrogenase subunit 6 [Clavisyllis tenjini]WGF21044.1 NADH dehydrogenase subunit 6 [Clavisyllis tenjini]
MFNHILPLISISMSLSLIFVISPLTLGVWIIILTLFLSMSASLFLSSWYPLLIFLIYVGGLLVMFAYFVAIQPNQKLGLFKMIFTTSFAFYYSNTSISSLLSPSIINTDFFSSVPLLLSHNLFISSFMATILFVTLILVTKLTSLNKGPLRPFF